jgi:hypothetical protein
VGLALGLGEENESAGLVFDVPAIGLFSEKWFSHSVHGAPLSVHRSTQSKIFSGALLVHLPFFRVHQKREIVGNLPSGAEGSRTLDLCIANVAHAIE